MDLSSLLSGSGSEIGLTGSARQDAIDHAGNISKVHFEIGIGVLTGLAILSVATRYAIRYRSNVRRLYLDDIVLIFGSACLIVAVALLYRFIDDMFLFEAIVEIPDEVTILSVLEDGEVGSLLDSNKIIQSYLCMIWTAIFAVKFSFLAYFRSLGASFSRVMGWYFWVVVGFTFVAWGTCMGGGFINCPYFGVKGVQCMPNDPHSRFTAVTAVLTTLDVLTDVMIVSIPLTLLHRTSISTQQKTSLGALLSLSLVMIVFAFVRLAGIVQPDRANLDVTWEMFWQHMEGCVAVAMGSLTAFRALLNRGGSGGSGGGGGVVRVGSGSEDAESSVGRGGWLSSRLGKKPVASVQGRSGEKSGGESEEEELARDRARGPAVVV